MAPRTPSISTGAKPPLDLPPLPDYLRPGLKLVFVGYNPGERSARLGHYYANPGNLFWPALSCSGLVPEPLTFLDDYRLPEFGIGITDLAKRPSRSAAELGAKAYVAGRAALRRKLGRVKPRVIAFNGKGVYELFTGRPCALGLQPELLFGARVFVLPSTSARYPGHSRAEKKQWFRRLKQLMDSVSTPRMSHAKT